MRYFAITILFLFIIFTPILKTSAQSSSFLFGGKILRSFPCTCSGNYMIIIGPPVGGRFVWYPQTPQYRERQLPRAGVWTLGLYRPGGICTGGSGCEGVPVDGTITATVGTSF